MILLLLLLIPNIVYADATDFINGYSFANVMNNNCDDCDDCRAANRLLRSRIIQLDKEIKELLDARPKKANILS